MRVIYVVSYKYPKCEEQKKTYFTVSLVLQFVDEVLRDMDKPVEYIRISPRII